MFELDMIGFRRLAEADLPLMHSWLNSPQVSQWYGENSESYDDVAAHYLPAIRGEEPAQPYLITYAGEPVGYIQHYLLSDYPEHQQRMGVTERAAGTDTFIGHPDYIHRGLGAPILRRFLCQVVFADPTVESCVLDPEPENTIAIRVYEKVGFQHLHTVPASAGMLASYVMRVPRAAVIGD